MSAYKDDSNRYNTHHYSANFTWKIHCMESITFLSKPSFKAAWCSPPANIKPLTSRLDTQASIFAAAQRAMAYGLHEPFENKKSAAKVFSWPFPAPLFRESLKTNKTFFQTGKIKKQSQMVFMLHLALVYKFIWELTSVHQATKRLKIIRVWGLASLSESCCSGKLRWFPCHSPGKSPSACQAQSARRDS